MRTKTESQVFVFPDLSQQYFPNVTSNNVCVVMPAKFDAEGNFVALDLSGKKFSDGELVFKTGEDLATEKTAEGVVLDAQCKNKRKAALMSFELTIFPDTTLNADQQNDIRLVRQKWKDMTAQTNYPFEFVEPALEPLLWQ